MAIPSDASATSSSLLLRVRAGETAAWDRLLSLYSPLVWNWCRRSGLREQDAADIVQDVFQAVAGHLEGFQKRDGGFRGWLRIITRHKICDLFRRRDREPAAAGGSEAQRWFGQVADLEPPDASASDSADHRFLVRRVTELLRAEFSESTWRAFWRTAIDGLSAADVAAELGMTAGAVRVARCRVLQRLRLELAGTIEPPDDSV